MRIPSSAAPLPIVCYLRELLQLSIVLRGRGEQCICLYVSNEVKYSDVYDLYRSRFITTRETASKALCWDKFVAFREIVSIRVRFENFLVVKCSWNWTKFGFYEPRSNLVDLSGFDNLGMCVSQYIVCLHCKPCIVKATKYAMLCAEIRYKSMFLTDVMYPFDA